MTPIAGFRTAMTIGGVLTLLLLAGCAQTMEAPPELADRDFVPLPEIPPSAANAEETFDYEQRELATMTEDDRAEYIAEKYAPKELASAMPPLDVFGDEVTHGLPSGSAPHHQTLIERRVLPDRRCWTVIGPGYSPYAEAPPRYHRSYNRYVGVGPRHTFPANTLFYGALGGVIGHQSRDRDKGILIGGTYGLLLDLMRW